MTNQIPTARGWALLQQFEIGLIKGTDVGRLRALAEGARAYFSFPASTDDDSYSVWFTWAAVTGQLLQLDFNLQTVTNASSAPADNDIVWNFGDGAGGAPVVTNGLLVPSTLWTNAVVNKALTTNVATLTTNGAHGLIVGETVRVALTTPDSVFDGLQTVTAVPTTSTFTYAKTNANVTSAAAPGVIIPVGGATALKRHVFPTAGTYHVIATVDTSADPAVLYDALVAVPYKA